ncbi:hypothetical protein IC617_08615 [Neiella sp. HB171785]|uniref:Uncharacterized protein n=1 Tax=Neiella litorisoli TaxID=2771431 RepID=A0A8J6QUT8_9GAMM|nr:hypothetical protein [Neiella litorisoli]MBD1389488.1 hypothetical protein [Neiella litorisoli]
MNSPQQQPKRSQARSRQPEKRKALLQPQNFESTVLYRFLDSKGGTLFGAIERSAVLLRYTSDTLPINQDIEQFLDKQVFAIAEEEIISIEAQADEAEEMLAMELPEVQYPDNQKLVIEVTHPIFWKLIGLMARADKVMSRIELLHLAAVLPTEQHEHARHQLVSLFNRIQQKIFMVTSPGKRANRPYSVQQFLAALKTDGGMEALMSRLSGTAAPKILAGDTEVVSAQPDTEEVVALPDEADPIPSDKDSQAA